MAYQLPFLAVDQMLIAAYYARKNTVVPTLVAGIPTIACYAVAALATYSTLGLAGMAFANTVQTTSHAIILFILLTLALGDLGMRELGSGAVRILLAAAGMAAAGVGTLALLPQIQPRLFTTSTTAGSALLLIIAGSGASLAYFVLAWLLRIPELGLLMGTVRKRFVRA
jgi:putative peptidoglycan lipid II flippase